MFWIASAISIRRNNRNFTTSSTLVRCSSDTCITSCSSLVKSTTVPHVLGFPSFLLSPFLEILFLAYYDNLEWIPLTQNFIHAEIVIMSSHLGLNWLWTKGTSHTRRLGCWSWMWPRTCRNGSRGPRKHPVFVASISILCKNLTDAPDTPIPLPFFVLLHFKTEKWP